MEKEQVNQMMSEIEQLLTSETTKMYKTVGELKYKLAEKYLKYFEMENFNEYSKVLEKYELLVAVQTILRTIRRKF